MDDLVEDIDYLLDEVEELVEEVKLHFRDASYEEKLTYLSDCGRPRINMSNQQLLFLVRNDFNLSDMAAILNCSV